MVWHSYMLNPRDFLEDCLRYGKMEFWRTGFPWAAIDSCIENDSLEYSASRKAQEVFEAETQCAWDSLKELPTTTVSCPNCKQRLTCPWTTCDKTFFQPSSETDWEALGDGLADKEFRLVCLSCEIVIYHEALRAQKFRRDLERLFLKDVPMPGTILSIKGKNMQTPMRLGTNVVG